MDNKNFNEKLIQKITLNIISKISFETTKLNKLSFNEELIDKLIDEEFRKDEFKFERKEKIISIKLLKNSILKSGLFKEIKISSNSKNYQFNHFTIQEYLSSLFISNSLNSNNSNQQNKEEIEKWIIKILMKN